MSCLHCHTLQSNCLKKLEEVKVEGEKERKRAQKDCIERRGKLEENKENLCLQFLPSIYLKNKMYLTLAYTRIKKMGRRRSLSCELSVVFWWLQCRHKVNKILFRVKKGVFVRDEWASCLLKLSKKRRRMVGVRCVCMLGALLRSSAAATVDKSENENELQFSFRFSTSPLTMAESTIPSSLQQFLNKWRQWICV